MVDIPAPKRPRYSMEADLEIQVEDVIFQVQSFLVMRHSPVFRCMLEADMREAREGRICLPGKSKDEFQIIAPIFQDLDATPQITKENAERLLLWAREYQMEKLKQAIDCFLKDNVEVTVSECKLAADFDLLERKSQCICSIIADIKNQMPNLLPFTNDAAFMANFWPAIFDAAGLPQPTSEVLTTEDLWPFVCKAVHGQSILYKVLFGRELSVPVRFRGFMGVKLLRIISEKEVEISVPGVAKRIVNFSEVQVLA